MSCAPCKPIWLRVARYLETEDKTGMSLERLNERRMLMFLIAENAYHIGQHELELMPSGRTKYKEE